MLYVILLLLLEACFAYYLCYRTGALDSVFKTLLVSLIVAGAFTLRFFALDHITADYTGFLSKWVEWFRLNSGFLGLSQSVGNYNIPYLYFLALFSYLDINDLYLIKLLSIFFDIVLAWSVAGIVENIKNNKTLSLVSFLIVLYWPTVFLNGAYWAQCDSIYTALGIAAIYFGISDRPKRSMVFLALSFGFKLQAVFLMPVFALLLINKKLSLKDVLIFPVSYFLLVLPAIIIGRPALDTITLYLNQTDSIGTGLNYNSPSVFAFWDHKQISFSVTSVSRIAIIAAFVFMFIILVIGAFRSNKLDNHVIILAASVMSVGIPYLLPRMHERYFFPADILTLVCAIIKPKLIPAAILTEFASFLGYYAYLTGKYLLLMKYGAIALLAALLLLLVSYIMELFSVSSDNFQHVSD